MTIQNGFGNQPVDIIVSAVEKSVHGRKGDIEIRFHVDDSKVRAETGSYATLEELLALRDELNSVIQEIVK
jgi:methionine synthase II (cobalamin-independent)